jgi:hypothetical protein
LFDRRPSVISRDPQNQNSRDKILQRGISELGTRLRAYLPTITAIDRPKSATLSIAPAVAVASLCLRQSSLSAPIEPIFD